jgi:Low-density lipoprotein receptor repeat class B
MCPSPRIRVRVRRARSATVLAATSSLVALMIPLLALAPSASAQVYYTAFLAEGGTGIERAAFDGTGSQSLEVQPTGFADAIALDVAAGKMYWTETSAGAIWRANLDGTEPQTILIDSGREPLGVALDLAHEQMYWTDSEGVKRAKLDGTSVELLTKEAARGFIALDLATQQIFWADWPSGTIRAAPMTGTTTVTSIVKAQPCPFGIAVDEVNGDVYWLGLEVKEKAKCEESASISRSKLDGSALETIIARPRAGFEGGLAVDPAAGRLYWAEAEAHDIRVANLDGSGARVLFATGGDFPIGLALDTTDPRPVNTAAPTIEGNAAVGSPLYCNAGSWTGIGPISFSYQWQLATGGAIEAATTSVFVPSSELAGAAVQCAVSAADSIETTSATSAAVLVGAYPTAVSSPARQALVAAIAVGRLTAHGSSARVPLFTSLAGVATLEAIPRPVSRRARARRRAARSRRHRNAHPHRETRARIVVRHAVHRGRDTLVLTKLKPGGVYTLRLTVKSADGQIAGSSATLRVAHR